MTFSENTQPAKQAMSFENTSYSSKNISRRHSTSSTFKGVLSKHVYFSILFTSAKTLKQKSPKRWTKNEINRFFRSPLGTFRGRFLFQVFEEAYVLKKVTCGHHIKSFSFLIKLTLKKLKHYILGLLCISMLILKFSLSTM